MQKDALSVTANIDSLIFDYLKIPVRTWTHVCGVFSTSGVILYINKNVIRSGRCKISPNVFLQDIALVIGADGYIGTPLSGKIADIRLYRRALTSDDIAKINGVININDDAMTVQEEVIPTSNTSTSDDTDQRNSEEPPNDSIVDMYSAMFSKTSINFNKIHFRELFAKSDSVTYFYINNERNVYSEASQICKRFGGEIPKATREEDIVLWTRNYKVGMSTFWLHSSKTLEDACEIGMLSPTQKLISVPSSCNNTCFVLCQTDSDTQIKLYGYYEQKILRFSPIYENSMLVFDSFDKYVVLFDDDSTVKIINTEEQSFIERPLMHFSTFMGRHTWTIMPAEKQTIVLSFSACGDTEFTCNNGDCVDVSKVCDLTNHCSDGTDENVCAASITPDDGYKFNYSEAQGTTDKTEVHGVLNLKQIDKVNMEDSRIEIMASMRVTWSDKRLNFKFMSINKTSSIEEPEFRFYWLPDVIIGSVIQPDINKFSVVKNRGDMSAETFKDGYPDIHDTHESKSLSSKSYYDSILKIFILLKK